MKRTEQDIDECMVEVLDLIHKFRNTSKKITGLIPIEEEIRRAKAFCTHYFVRESAESIGLNSSTLKGWMRRRNIPYI